VEPSASDARLTTSLSPWREAVRAAAEEAATVDSRHDWGANEIAFNYRWEHVQSVVPLAIRLAELTGADIEIVEAAAWLHDVAKPHSQEHGRDGAAMARQILAGTDFPPEKVDAVAEAIERHVGLFTDEAVEPLEAAVLWDADKLSKLGATAVLHFVGYQIMMGQGTTAAWLDQLPDLSWMERTVGSFQTSPARAIGRHRLDTYRNLWTHARWERDGDDLTGDVVPTPPPQTARQPVQQMTQLAALREIGRAINAAWDLQATLDLITRRTADVMAMDSCSIYLLDAAQHDGEHDGGRLVLQATTGLASEAVGRAWLQLGEGLTGWAAQTGRPVAVADAARDPRFKFLPETEETRFQSLLAVPLVNQGRVIGAMNVQTRTHHEFSSDEVELLSLIADLAAGALEKAMLYEGMQRQIDELSALAEVSETITSPRYLDEMLEIVVEMAARVMKARLCSLMLLDESTGELVLRATQHLSLAYRDKPRLLVGQGIVGLVAQTGQPMTVLDVRQDPRYRHVDVARQEGLCSLLCVPLTVRRRVIGVLTCYTAQPHHFSEEETALFSTLANQTALAIENARLVTNAAVVREMHHRIKNNLQNVAMLLRLQMSDDQQLSAKEVLHESVNRILSIAAVHEVLSQRGFRLVDVKEVLTRVGRAVAQNMRRPDLKVDVVVEGDEIALPSQAATSLALAVNELIQNALEHAFADRARGSVVVSLHRVPGQLTVEVLDDGVGFSGDSSRQLGLEIVDTLVCEDLRGEWSLRGGDGTMARITIPLEHGG
jgi:putative nucleotidyltransferase with HDIG domain